MRSARAGALLAVAVVIAGCGATATPDVGDTRTNAPSAATTYSNIPPLPGTGTLTTPLPGTGKPGILLGDMNTPEQFVLGALYQEALSAQGYAVSLTRNIGPTAVSQEAIQQGSLNIYPQYLDVFLSKVVRTQRPLPSLRDAYVVAQRYAEHHGMTLLPPTPFSDTSGIAVSARYAALHHLSTLAQLPRVAATLILGSPLEFSTSPAGLPALEAAYGFVPGILTSVNIGNQYSAMRSGAIDGAYVQTTDGDLTSDAFVTLADTKRFYGYGNVIPVVSTKVLAAEGPVFAETINHVDALLTQSAMRGLNAEMAASQLDPEAIAGEVARDFLQAYGLVAEPPWSTITSTSTTPTSAAATTTAATVTSTTTSGTS